MLSRRYTLLVADRTTRRRAPGDVLGAARHRRGLCSRHPAGAHRRRCRVESEGEVGTPLRQSRSARVENASYRSATESLAGQIDRSQSAIEDLGPARPSIPTWPRPWTSCRRSSRRAPWAVAQTEAGGNPDDYTKHLSALATPEDTFGLLRNLLGGLQSGSRRTPRTSTAGTPWPPPRRRSGRIKGWITSTMGYRQ